MAKFNLLEEPWISVITDEKGTSKDVSMLELFENAPNYLGLSGDMVTQDFAVFRVLLAVLQTVFTRYHAQGEPYEYFELDEKMKQISEIDEDDIDDYKAELKETWKILWEMGKFPEIVRFYLLQWHDRFYLFDDTYPFYQVTEEEVKPEKVSGKGPTSIRGKNINRLISESGNKISLFSPKYEASDNKEYLTKAEIARWLIMFQCYCGLSDKVIFGKEKYKASKGWLFDVGGIFLEGNNLFETLLLNMVLVHPEEQYLQYSQKPCWEYSPKERIERYRNGSQPDNLSELYTNWSRAIYISPEFQANEPFQMGIVKLPEIEHKDQFLEPMTMWKHNTSGENKDTKTPKKHIASQSMWRNFGLIAISDVDNGQKKPGIIDWLNQVEKMIGNQKIHLRAVSMKDDGNATSWVPTDEIIDFLNLNDILLTDVQENGWVPRIDEVVELTKKVVGFAYKNFMSDIKEIRNVESKDFVNNETEVLYFQIDQPFRIWLSSIRREDEKDKKVIEWKKTLKDIALRQAENFVKQAGPRDYVGIVKDERVKNIATAYQYYRYLLNKYLM